MHLLVHASREFFDEFPLRLSEVLGHFELDGHDLITGAVAAESGHSLAPKAQLESRLRARRNAHPDFALERWHFDHRAQRRLRKTDRYLAVQIVALPSKKR